MLINNIRKSPTCPIRNTIHAPTRGATVYEMTGYLTPEDFNPRSYKRSDYDGYHRALHPQISIHAPTRGATWVIPGHKLSILFQSTLLQEERHLFNIPINTITYFNPRSYKRSDFYKIHLHLLINISIHAPTRGATKQHNDPFGR